MRRICGRRLWAVLSIAVSLTTGLAGQKKGGGGSAPDSTSKVDYPIVHVRKWEVKYTLQASERFSYKGPLSGGGEMYHQPTWSISGSAIVEMSRPDGVDRVVPASASSNSWSGVTQSSGNFRGEVGTVPPVGLTEMYIGGGPADPTENRLLFQVNAKEQTYEINLSLRMDAELVSDASVVLKMIDEAKREGEARRQRDPKRQDDVSDPFSEAVFEWLHAAMENTAKKRSRPFKMSFNPTALRMPLPAASGGVPTISGSKKVQEIVSEVSPGTVNGIFSWTITPYDESKKADVTLSGCSELGIGQQGKMTAKGQPPGGTYRFWVEPSSAVAVTAQGGTAQLTGTAPAKATVHVEYTGPGGKTGTASQPITCLKIESINGGQPVPKIGLFDADGKPTSAIRSVPVAVQPEGAGDLLSYKPADPGVLTAVSEGSSVALQGVRVGKTTFQAGTKCGGATGPVVGVEVVPCDDGVQKTLTDQEQTISEELKRLAQYDEEIRSGEDFQTAEKIDEATLDLAIKTGSLIVGVLGAKGASPSVKTAADVIGYASNVRDAMKGDLDNFISATAQTLVQAAGSAVQGAIAGAIDTVSAADQFGKSLGAMLGTSQRLEANRAQFEHWNRLKQDLVRRQKICRPGKEKPGPQDGPSPPKKEQPPKPDQQSKKPTPPPKDRPPAPPGPPPTTPPAPADQPPVDQPPGGDRPPLPPPETPPPPVTGLPYQEDCGCSRTAGDGQKGGLARTGGTGQAGEKGGSVGIGGAGQGGGTSARGTSVGRVSDGLNRLQQCVELFRNGPLTDYQQTLNEWQTVFSQLRTAVANEAGRESAIKALLPLFDDLLARTKEFDEKGRIFNTGFESCPREIESSKDLLLAPLAQAVQ